jgi:hypothetical protein
MSATMRRAVRSLLGERPCAIVYFISPTLFAVALDLLLRARSLSVFPPKEWLNYFGSSLASAGFWGGPLWISSRLFTIGGRAARAALALFSVIFVFPLALFCFGGQALYFHVFHAYMARDTVRLGIALRGTLGAWLASWGGSLAVMGVVGLVMTVAILLLARRGAMPVRNAWPLLPVVGFAVAAYCFWIDFVESRSLQAAPPDTCFIHGAMHAIHDGITGKGWVRHGISLREPTPLPALTLPPHRRNVIFIVSESVRADAMCSSSQLGCKAQFLEDVAADRMPLGRLTMQSSGTFTSCVLLWTGLGPDEDFQTMHRAPVLWEVAQAVGYRTAYIGSQNLRYDDFAAFFKRAGIDVMASAADLGNASDAHVGAPDENATARMLAFVRTVPDGTPYFAVLHLSNTHWPYRVDPGLLPYAPHDNQPFGDTQHLHNHYRNSVLLQERTVAALVRDLRALPSWEDTVVLFVSDHGEEFREHGGLYHLTSLFDEQVRVPGWLLAGPAALDSAQRDAISSYTFRRTFSQDVHATVLDLLGVFDQKATFPYAARAGGRSLLRSPPVEEPMVLLSTASGVWEPDNPKYGVMRGDMFAVRSSGADWQCFNTKLDPKEMGSLPSARCADLVGEGIRRFGRAPR